MLTVIMKRENMAGFCAHIPTHKGKSIAFLHRAVENPREGIFRIEKRKDRERYTFIGGQYVEPQKINVNNLTPDQLYQLSAYGKVDYKGEIFGYECLIVEDVAMLDRAKYLALLINDRFEFILLYKPIEAVVRYTEETFFMNRHFIHKGFMNPHLAISSRSVDLDSLGLEEDSIILKNPRDIIWRRLIKDDNDSHIALYRADKINEFNRELHTEILNFNREMADELRQRLSGDSLNNLRKTLYFYGLL